MDEQTTTNRATPFLAAFNDIEAYLRELLSAKRSDNFRWMVDLAVRKHLVSDEHAVELKEFAELRNAITHGLYTEDMRPIAEPLPETVAEIERIRDLLRNPPTALGVLGHHEVRTFSPGDDIRDALRIIRRTKISQFPVYEGGRCVGLLTTNTIARWVAADLDDNDHLDARSIAEVLDWAEENDRAVFLPKEATVQEVLDALTTPRRDGSLPRAGILTEHGHKDQRPIRVIGGADIAKLLEALNG